MSDLHELLNKPEFPRSSQYDHDFMLDNQMGPNALWLVEWLTQSMNIRPGDLVLDLGCGRAMTSIFLAKEFGAKVFATDLWIGPDNNLTRAKEAGVGDRVFPLRTEAHALPFAGGFFDAVISIDAYQYFGTNVLYLNYLANFVREGGEIGVVVPGLMQRFDDVPEHLATPQSNGHPFWEPECWCFQTADWWKRTVGRCPAVSDAQVREMPDGWRHWRDFERALELSGKGIFPSVAEALDKDAGEYIGFVGTTVKRNSTETMNLFDPTIGVRFGVDS